MKEVIRAFIAIELPPNIRGKLGYISQRLQDELKGIPIRWVKAENIHLTLKFLGDVSVSNLKILEEILMKEAEEVNAFELSIGELGAFPNPRRARVLWVNVIAPPELQTLQHAIELQAARLGYVKEEHPFSPHLTLGRVNRTATPEDLSRIAQVLQQTQVGFVDVAPVEGVKLYRSDLQPSGSVYTCLYNAPFKQIPN